MAKAKVRKEKEEISYDMFFENEEEDSLLADLIDKSESAKDYG